MKARSSRRRDRHHPAFRWISFPSAQTGFSPSRWVPFLVVAVGATQPFLPPAARAAESDGVVAVYSAVSPGYSRTVLAGGSFKQETYAFGEGGVQGGTIKDETFDKLKFIDVARVVAPPLASQNYLPCNPADPHRTDLLIMVYWGTTIGTDRASGSPEYQIAQSMIPPPRAAQSLPPSGLFGNGMALDPSESGRKGEGEALAAVRAADNSALDQSALITNMANRQRDRQDTENAAILGYLPELKRVDAYKMTMLSQRRQDIVDEVEESRYYVVLMAYDFQALLKHKGKKLLWETRFSIRQRHNDFGEQLAAMAQSASHSFGQNTGLVRKPLPAVQVEMGELKSLGPER